MAYAELHCLSNFSFLRGAAHPEELVERAAALGYRALALTDECSVAGAVRAHLAAHEHGLKLIVGSEFRLEDGLRCVLLATDRRGYGELCRLITRARRAAPKGRYRLERDDFVAHSAAPFPGLLALWLPGSRPDPPKLPGSPPSSRAGCGSRWNCSLPGRTADASNRCSGSGANWACRCSRR